MQATVCVCELTCKYNVRTVSEVRNKGMFFNTCRLWRKHENTSEDFLQSWYLSPSLCIWEVYGYIVWFDVERRTRWSWPAWQRWRRWNTRPSWRKRTKGTKGLQGENDLCVFLSELKAPNKRSTFEDSVGFLLLYDCFQTGLEPLEKKKEVALMASNRINTKNYWK